MECIPSIQQHISNKTKFANHFVTSTFFAKLNRCTYGMPSVRFITQVCLTCYIMLVNKHNAITRQTSLLSEIHSQNTFVVKSIFAVYIIVVVFVDALSKINSYSSMYNNCIQNYSSHTQTVLVMQKVPFPCTGNYSPRNLYGLCFKWHA